MLDIIKKNLATIIQGIMFGFGFCIAAWTIYFTIQANTNNSAKYQREATATTEISTQKKEDKFIFRDVEEIHRNGRAYFIGRVQNNGSSPAEGVSIEVDLFMENKFVDKYSTYVTGDIEPGGERYFKVSCGCKNEPPAEHDSYKIEVVGGY